MTVPQDKWLGNLRNNLDSERDVVRSREAYPDLAGYEGWPFSLHGQVVVPGKVAGSPKEAPPCDESQQ